ncbi:MAG TPA: DUF1254 domain-containing protein [Rhizomicrobium sp.]|nr:DUF1254 domain-containing protein [Rhizomicrobium sp.]
MPMTPAKASLHSDVEEATLSPQDGRAIARDAYIYGFPMVDSYRILYSYFVDHNGPEYKGGWNRVHSTARVYTPDDKAIQTPNSDTPYSMVGADLRREPLVLTVPKIEAGRYYSLQFIDLYTFNFAYVGSRTTGNDEGNFLLAGPGWRGEAPPGIRQVIRCETELALVLYRTQLFSPLDIANVKKVQAGYQILPLSAFLGHRPPPAAPPIDFVRPISVSEERTSVEFFNQLNFLLQFCPVHPSEQEIRARFEQLGIGPGGDFHIKALAPDMLKAVHHGMADAWDAYDQTEQKLGTGELTSGQVFGTRDTLQNNYLYRMLAAVDGIYGNSQDEAIYPVYAIDSDGRPLDASAARYELRFPPGQLPPVNAFWSLTLYEMPARMLVKNPLNRYLINSPMLESLHRDADGGITLHIQHFSPGGDREANWLPAPAGPFMMGLRLYWPKPEALEKRWKAPPLTRMEQS